MGSDPGRENCPIQGPRTPGSTPIIASLGVLSGAARRIIGHTGPDQWPAIACRPIEATIEAIIEAEDFAHVPPLRNLRRLVHGYLGSPVGGGLPVRPRRVDAE